MTSRYSSPPKKRNSVVSAHLAKFEATIANNHDQTSSSFLTNVAASNNSPRHRSSNRPSLAVYGKTMSLSSMVGNIDVSSLHNIHHASPRKKTVVRVPASSIYGASKSNHNHNDNDNDDNDFSSSSELEFGGGDAPHGDASEASLWEDSSAYGQKRSSDPLQQQQQLDLDWRSFPSDPFHSSSTPLWQDDELADFHQSASPITAEPILSSEQSPPRAAGAKQQQQVLKDPTTTKLRRAASKKKITTATKESNNNSNSHHRDASPSKRSSSRHHSPRKHRHTAMDDSTISTAEESQSSSERVPSPQRRLHHHRVVKSSSSRRLAAAAAKDGTTTKRKIRVSLGKASAQQLQEHLQKTSGRRSRSTSRRSRSRSRRNHIDDDDDDEEEEFNTTALDQSARSTTTRAHRRSQRSSSLGRDKLQQRLRNEKRADDRPRVEAV